MNYNKVCQELVNLVEEYSEFDVVLIHSMRTPPELQEAMERAATASVRAKARLATAVLEVAAQEMPRVRHEGYLAESVLRTVSDEFLDATVGDEEARDWENVLAEAAGLTVDWTTRVSCVPMSREAQTWLLESLGSSPKAVFKNEDLRPQLLRFIEMWPESDVRERSVEVTTAIITACGHLQVHHLLPGELPGLMPTLLSLMTTLVRCDALEQAGLTACEQLYNLNVGTEALWLACLLELSAQLCEEAYDAAQNTDGAIMLMHFGVGMLVALATNNSLHFALQQPGMAHLVAAVVVRVLNVVSQRAEVLYAAERSYYISLTQACDQLLRVLNRSSSDVNVPRVLRENHTTELMAIQSALSAVEIRLRHVPRLGESNTPDDVPEEFLDAVTSGVMTNPVRLPSSGEVVDASTYVYLVLTKPEDPFTRATLIGSPERVTDLKERINIWMRRFS